MTNFIPMKNKARQYINTETGEVVSRRQYLQQEKYGKSIEAKVRENKAAKQGGGKKITTGPANVAVAETPTEEKQESRYVSFVRSYALSHNLKYQQTTRDAEFKMVYRQITDRIREMKKLDPHIKGGTKDTILRKLLKDSGIPEDEWYFIYLG